MHNQDYPAWKAEQPDEDVVPGLPHQEMLSTQQEHLAQLVEHLADGVILLDHTRRIVLANPVAQTYLELLSPSGVGDVLDTLAGQSLEPLLLPAPAAGISHEITLTQPARRVFEITSRMIEQHAHTDGWTLTIRDITDRKLTEEHIQHMALYDALTELPNRVLFRNRLQQAIAQAWSDGQIVAVMFLDLDRFKTVNDTMGHAFGDRLLQIVALRLLECVRQNDTVARLGGDEFTIILAQIQNTDHIDCVAQRILSALIRPFHIDGYDMYTSVSIGIALYPFDADDTDSLLTYADMAMYHAKSHGRNAYTFYTATMHAYAMERMMLEKGLQRAIEQEEYLLHYQLQIDLGTGAIVGLEALVRWRHPVLGMISPSRFLTIAEESGLTASLGLWILRTACAQNRAWQLAGLSPIRIAVNLSARQLAHPDMVNEVAQILTETQLEARYLELELTESSIIHDPETAITILHKLKALGVHIAIDDFGTGYSSLSYLKRFPINTLKIDQSFIRDIPADVDGAAIATTIIGMAHGLKLKVIAEGVETHEQEHFLHDQGCDEAQGYLYSHPLPPTEMTRLLQTWDAATRSGQSTDG
jgi:diguanylate cyclase (GGDEF)-like protein